MMAVVVLAAAAIAVWLQAIVTEAGWKVKCCCTAFEPEPKNREQIRKQHMRAENDLFPCYAEGTKML
jgi:hypothetical protein